MSKPKIYILYVVALLALVGCEARVHLESKPAVAQSNPYEVVELNGEYAVRFLETGYVGRPTTCEEAHAQIERIKAWDAERPEERRKEIERARLPWKKADCDPAPIVFPETNYTNTLPYLSDWTNITQSIFTFTASNPFLTIETNGIPSIEIGWDGNVTLLSTNLTEVSKIFWKSVSEVFPEFREALLKHQAAE